MSQKLLVDQNGAPLDRIVGFETEYGLSCETTNKFDAEPAEVQITNAALESERSQFRADGSKRKRNEFRSDGDREYVDVGNHPELSTAEELSFSGAAHRVLAGHVKMARYYRQITKRVIDRWSHETGVNPVIKKMNLIANTCDKNNNSWASHENFLARRNLEPYEYIEGLAVHNLSRIVWSGAGHVLPGKAFGGYRFALSEKAEHIWEVANDSTCRNRPLVNLRDDAEANPELYRRIHIVAGESVCNPFTNALRLASGSIVLRACELGVDFEDLMPENVITAIRKISRDPTLQQKIELLDGRQFSGLDLQREVAERAITAATADDYITEQEKEWGDEWITLLDDLAADPQICAKRTDWVVKQNLIDREVSAKRSSDESDISVAWSKAMDYHRLLPKEGMGMKLVREGYFKNAPTNEVLDGGLPLPPTRAMLRGEAVRQLEARDDEFCVDWVHVRVVDGLESSRTILLQDPYATEDERLAQMLADAA